MIELFSICFTVISLLVLSNFPLNYFVFEKKFNDLNLTYSDSLLINSILICNLLFITSFFSINLNFLFIFLIMTSTILILLKIKSHFLLIKNRYAISLVFLVFIYSMSIQIGHNGYLEWDGLAHWLIKAKVFFSGGSYEDLKNVPMNYYPHLGSYIWAFYWHNSILQYEYLGRIFFIFIFLLSTFTLISKFSKKLGNIEQIIILILITCILTNFYLFGGYQEHLIFFAFFCFSYFFLKFNENHNLYKKKLFPEIILILIINITLWTKQEGFFYSIILSIIFLIYSRRNLIFKYVYFFLFLLIISLFIYIKIYYFQSVNFNEKIINAELIKNLNIKYLINKIFIISKYMIISFFKYPIWILIFSSLFLLKKNTDFFEKNKFFIPSLIVLFCFVFAIFLQTTMNLNFLVPITLNRLIFAISGLFIILPIQYYVSLKKKL